MPVVVEQGGDQAVAATFAQSLRRVETKVNLCGAKAGTQALTLCLPKMASVQVRRGGGTR